MFADLVVPEAVHCLENASLKRVFCFLFWSVSSYEFDMANTAINILQIDLNSDEIINDCFGLFVLA